MKEWKISKELTLTSGFKKHKGRYLKRARRPKKGGVLRKKSVLKEDKGPFIKRSGVPPGKGGNARLVEPEVGGCGQKPMGTRPRD